jgi:hypothetical protein
MVLEGDCGGDRDPLELTPCICACRAMEALLSSEFIRKSDIPLSFGGGETCIDDALESRAI